MDHGWHTPRRIGLAVAVALTAASTARALATAGPSPSGGVEGLKVVRVRVADVTETRRLEHLVRDVWTEHAEGDQIDALTSPDERAALDREGFEYTVVVDDLAALLAAQFGARAAPLSTDASAIGADFFMHYHPYDQIVAYMQHLVAAYPRLASMVEVGTTVEGRTIYGLRITSHQRRRRNPTIVVWAAQHAREWAATMIPPYLATSLLEGYGTDPAMRRLVRRVEWLLVPVVNVDGYVYTWTNPTGEERLWRKNRRDDGSGAIGVDLNRNWEWGWDDPSCPPSTIPLTGVTQPCSSTDPMSDLYRGPTAFSEPETQALRDYLLAHANVYAVVDLHSFGQLIMWPNGFTPDPTPDDATFGQLGSAMQAFVLAAHGRTYKAGPVFSAIYPARGNAGDWTYNELGLVSFSFEVRPGPARSIIEAYTGFTLPEDQIVPVVEEIAPALRLLAQSKVARHFRKTRQVRPAVCGGTRRRCRYGR